MTDPNVNPNGQVPGQQADANPTEPLNAMTAETGTAANNAPTQAIAAGEQPTQAFTPVRQPTQAFTPAEQPTQPFAQANQPVPPTQALPPVTPAAAPAPAPAAPAPAPAPAAPSSPYPGAAPASGSVPPVYGSGSVRYIRAAGPCLRKRPITRICKAANRTASRDGLVLTAVCRLKRTGSTTAWLLPVLSARSLSHSSV